MNTTHTFIGNIVAKPDYKELPSGTAVCEFRIAVNDRYRDSTGEWKNRPSSFWAVQVWRDQAAAVRDQLDTGNEVVVIGELRTEEWEQEGQRRSRKFVAGQVVAKTVRQPRTATTAAASNANQPDWDSE